MTDIEDDPIIGTAVETLLEEGDEQAAALLLDVMGYQTHFIDAVVTDDSRDYAVVSVTLTVPRYLISRFTGDPMDRIERVLRSAGLLGGVIIQGISVEEPLAEAGWRARAEARLGQGPSNQAGIGAAPRRWLSEDRMRFRDSAELAAYRAFKRAQDRLPKHQSITILPNPSAKTRLDTTWSPDFVVAYRGRAGIVEIDGSTHQGRAAADHSRDRFFEDCGVAYVDRWTVEDTNDDAALDELVDRFLLQLAGG